VQAKRNTFLFRILLTAALVSISILATTSSEIPLIENISDKVNHLVAFFVLALLVDFSWPESGFLAPKILSLLGYGLAIEIVQYFFPARSFSILDLAVDAAGLFLYRMAVPLLKTLPPCKGRWKLHTDDTI
jgi:VanZ family protein